MSDQLRFLWDQLPNLLWGFPNHRPGGLLLSVLLSTGATLVGLGLAIVFGFLTHSRFWPARVLANRLVWVVRGVPLLVLLVLAFQVLGSGMVFGIELERVLDRRGHADLVCRCLPG